MHTQIDPDVGTIAPPLTEARFLETHVAFEAASTQQPQILEQLAAMTLPAGARVLSVGCGSGILDIPLAARWLARGALEYVALEPSPRQCELAVAGLRALGIPSTGVTSTFEAFETEQRFDLVMFVHTHYYLDDVAASLAKAATLLTEHGRLVVVAAPRGALNRLASEFWPDRDVAGMWFAEELLAHFHVRGTGLNHAPLDGRLDVTPCLLDMPAGEAIRDFVVQADTRQLSEGVRARIDDALRKIARRELGGRWTVPHPAELFSFEAANARRLA